jgi:hypothetical protein
MTIKNRIKRIRRERPDCHAESFSTPDHKSVQQHSNLGGIMKIVKIISEHLEKNHPGQKGMVEAIVKLKDGSVVTRHIYPADADKAEQEQA